jgi:curved DNA-binding protein
MAKDYYRHLGLPRTATEAEIKSAYRKLAVEHHPDKNGDPIQFHAINEAYAVLGSPEKKRDYDAAQSVALVTDLDQASAAVVDDFFSQFNLPPTP